MQLMSESARISSLTTTEKEGILGFRKILTSSVFLIGSETHIHEAL